MNGATGINTSGYYILRWDLSKFREVFGDYSKFVFDWRGAHIPTYYNWCDTVCKFLSYNDDEEEILDNRVICRNLSENSGRDNVRIL